MSEASCSRCALLDDLTFWPGTTIHCPACNGYWLQVSKTERVELTSLFPGTNLVTIFHDSITCPDCGQTATGPCDDVANTKYPPWPPTHLQFVDDQGRLHLHAQVPSDLIFSCPKGHRWHRYWMQACTICGSVAPMPE